MYYKAILSEEMLEHFRLDDNGKTLVLTDKSGFTRGVELTPVESIDDDNDAISRKAVLQELMKHQHSEEFCKAHDIDYAIDSGMVRIVVGNAKPVTTPRAVLCEVKFSKEQLEELVTNAVINLTNRIENGEVAIRKKNKWVEKPRYEGDTQPDLQCPNCGNTIEWWDTRNFCANCGMDLQEGEEE